MSIYGSVHLNAWPANANHHNQLLTCLRFKPENGSQVLICSSFAHKPGEIFVKVTLPENEQQQHLKIGLLPQKGDLVGGFNPFEKY